MTDGYYPEECDTTGGDCLQCVRRTADSMRALTADPTTEWASAVFQRIYSYAACRQMEHAFVWACGGAGEPRMGPQSAGPLLVQIANAAA